MARARLDAEVLKKVATKKGVPEKSVREQASRKAAKLGIPSEAALLVIARRHNIGINRALKRLDPTVRHQVADALKPSDHSQAAIRRNRTARQEPRQSGMAAASELLLTDTELRRRCADLLRKKRHLDRAVREAMTLVEDRLRRLTTLGKSQAPNRHDLVAKALNPDPTRALIVLSDDKSEQKGVFDICNGLMAVFGNRAHHSLRDDVTEAEALGICGAANVLLSLVSKAKVRTAAPPSGPATDMGTNA